MPWETPLVKRKVAGRVGADGPIPADSAAPSNGSYTGFASQKLPENYPPIFAVQLTNRQRRISWVHGPDQISSRSSLVALRLSMDMPGKQLFERPLRFRPIDSQVERYHPPSSSPKNSAIPLALRARGCRIPPCPSPSSGPNAGLRRVRPCWCRGRNRSKDSLAPRADGAADRAW